MADDILVVGGYGTVGRTVCTELAGAHSSAILVAGRTRERAAAFADSISGAGSRTIDLADPSTFEPALDGVDTAVVCVDAAETDFVEACLDRGIDYVDVTPTDAFIRDVEGLDGRARQTGATAVLSVGLTPGMTNLFAVDGAATLDGVDEIDIAVSLGLGEAYGRDTVEWTLDALLGTFQIRTDGRMRSVRPMTGPRSRAFPGRGVRRVYHYDLADQHVLTRTTDVPTIATRLCYSSRLATAALAGLSRLSLIERAVTTLGRERLVDLVEAASALPGGSGSSVISVRVDGHRDGDPHRVERWIGGPDQARATGIVAATAVRLLRADRHPAGVFHSHELFTPDPFVDRLADTVYAVGRAEVVRPSD